MCEGPLGSRHRRTLNRRPRAPRPRHSAHQTVCASAGRKAKATARRRRAPSEAAGARHRAARAHLRTRAWPSGLWRSIAMHRLLRPCGARRAAAVGRRGRRGARPVRAGTTLDHGAPPHRWRQQVHSFIVAARGAAPPKRVRGPLSSVRPRRQRHDRVQGGSCPGANQSGATQAPALRLVQAVLAQRLAPSNGARRGGCGRCSPPRAPRLGSRGSATRGTRRCHPACAASAGGRPLAAQPGACEFEFESDAAFEFDVPRVAGPLPPAPRAREQCGSAPGARARHRSKPAAGRAG